MRFCGGFLRRQQLSCPKKGHKTGSAARQSVGSALLAIEHADRDPALQTGLADGLERLDQRPAGRDDILDEADALARRERALDAVRCPVPLRLVAHDQERQLRRQRGGRRDDDGTELRRGEPNRVRLVLGDGRRDVLAERREHLRARLEAVLVEVVMRAAARAEDEVALEVRVLAEGGSEVLALHVRAARSASRAWTSSGAASGESLCSDTSEPSAK